MRACHLWHCDFGFGWWRICDLRAFGIAGMPGRCICDIQSAFHLRCTRALAGFSRAHLPAIPPEAASERTAPANASSASGPGPYVRGARRPGRLVFTIASVSLPSARLVKIGIWMARGRRWLREIQGRLEKNAGCAAHFLSAPRLNVPLPPAESRPSNSILTRVASVTLNRINVMKTSPFPPDSLAERMAMALRLVESLAYAEGPLEYHLLLRELRQVLGAAD